MLALRTKGIIENTGDEETAKVLRILHGAIPILNNQMCRILNVRQIQILCIYCNKEMHNSSVTGKLSKLILPHCYFSRKLLLSSEHLYCIERSGITNYRLLGFDNFSILKPDTSSTSIFNNDLINMSVQLKLSPELLQTSLQGISECTSSPDGYRVAGALLEETLQDVKHMSSHCSLSRKPTEDTHGIDKVKEKGISNNFIYRLVQRIKGQAQVKEYIWVCKHKWKRSSSGGKESAVLTKVKKRNSSS
mmetsp:Transcript_22761/g.33716  ORF Transcript_22761/g.33716 Transcript_22761/m.33716 type:complete len:248 (-) Transcript_22761:760-1503(-)